jgi:hypothetical protein
MSEVAHHKPTTVAGAAAVARSGRSGLGLTTLVVLLVAAAAFLAGVLQLRPPPAHPAAAPVTDFSAERAMRDLQAIAAQPRAMGTHGHAAARDYLVRQLRAMGLDPRVQTTTSANRLSTGQTLW